MNAPPKKEPPRRGAAQKNSDDTAKLPRPPAQRQLSVFLWITTEFPCWFRRPDHARMMHRMFVRIISEECHE